MSGFNKRSRLASQGSGKGPNDGKDGSSDKPAAPPVASAAKSGATSRKLQWSMGDLLNKLENPETELPAAKAALEVPPAARVRTNAEPPATQPSPAAKAKKLTKERPGSKPPEPTKSPVKPDIAKPVKDADKRKNTSEKATKPEPDLEPSWSEPALEPGWDMPAPAASDGWTPPTSDKDSEWSAVSGETVSSPQSSEKKELWGAAEQSDAWAMPQKDGPTWATPAKDEAAQELWAIAPTDSADSWDTPVSSDSASPELWAASGVAEPEREVWGEANLDEDESEPSEIKESFSAAEVSEPPVAEVVEPPIAETSSWEEPSTAQGAIAEHSHKAIVEKQAIVEKLPVERSASPDWETPGEAPSWERKETIDEPELWGEPSVVPDLSPEATGKSEKASAEQAKADLAKEVETKNEPTAASDEDVNESLRQPTSEREAVGNTASMLLKKAAEKKNALLSSQTRMPAIEPADAEQESAAADTEPSVSSKASAADTEPSVSSKTSSADGEPSVSSKGNAADIEPASPEAPTGVVSETDSEAHEVPDTSADDSGKPMSDSMYSYASTDDSAETGMFSITLPQPPAPKDRSFKSRLENAALAKFTTGRTRENEDATTDDAVSDTEASAKALSDSESVPSAEAPARPSSDAPSTSQSGLAAQSGSEKPGYAMGYKFGLSEQKSSPSSISQAKLTPLSASAPVPAELGESAAQEPAGAATPSTSTTKLPAQNQIAAQAKDVAPDSVQKSAEPANVGDQIAAQSTSGASAGAPPSQFSKMSGAETGKIMQSELMGMLNSEKLKDIPRPPKPDTIKAKPSIPEPPISIDRSKQPTMQNMQPTMGEKAPALPTRDQSPLRSAKAPAQGLRTLGYSIENKRSQRVLLVASSALLIACMAWLTWSFEQKRNFDTNVQTEFAARRYDDALATAEKALVYYPNEARFHFYKGRILRMRGDLAPALQSLMAADANEPNNQEVLKELGLLYCAQGQYKQSIADFDKAIGDGTKATADLFAGRGRTEMKTGALDKALTIFKGTAKLDPNNTQYVYDRADAFSGMHKYPDAIKTLSAVLAKQPRDAHALAMRALAQYQAKHTGAAIADIDKAVAIEPSATVYFYRGLIRAEQRQVASAIADFSHALKYDPNNTAIIDARAQAYTASGDFSKALSNYNALSNLQGGQDSPAFHERRAAAAFAAGNFKDAAVDYGKLLETRPDDVQLRLKHAASCEAVQEYARAYDDYEYLLKKDPKNVDYLVKRGFASAKGNHFSIAESDFEQAIAINPKNPAPYLVRGQVSQLQGNYDQAIVDVNHALKLQPNSEPAKRLLRELAKLHHASPMRPEIAAAPAHKVATTGDALTDGYKQMLAGEIPEAIDNFAIAIKKDPNKASIRRYLAHCLMQTERYSEAVEQFKALETLGALRADDENKYLKALAKAGMVEQGSEAYKKKLASDPSDIHSRLALAKLYSEAGSYQDALKVLRDGAPLAKSADDYQRLQQMTNQIKDNMNQNATPTPSNDQPQEQNHSHTGA